ncbi:hypothetical protein GGS24DRAFT_509886 [Hypoxylon argillaceum]|nr:hypothetical protein GGS24DRAFT_509886 [Hypoxylon argillaceum]
MATTRYHVLLFGDQTDDVTDTISDLYTASKESGLLAKFLRDASDVCQVEFGNVQPCFRKETPPFESLLEMAEEHAKTDGSPVLASCTVSYFARLGELILRAEHDPTILSTPRVLIGLCINLFPAALAATAKSATELATLSLEGFPSFFNWIVTNHARTKKIEWPHGSWSCMVSSQTDVNLQPLLDKFHEEHDVPEYKRTWIGVVGRGWVTVSGPPSMLKLLMAELSDHKDLSFMPLPIASAVHAPHMFDFDYEPDVKTSHIWKLELQEGACIMSTDECIPYSAKTLDEVTRQILPAVLYAPLMMEETFEATAKYLKGACATATVSILGPSIQAISLIRALQHAGIPVDMLPKFPYKPHTSVRSGSGAVAIVGMSARLPQANDLEEFWKVLIEGQTTHKRVPPERFNLDDFYDPTGTKKNTMMNTDGCFLSNPGAFDTRLFNISPREAMQLDPTHRLLLMTSLEALEKAGYNPDAGLSSRNRRAAVYFGQNADFWREVNAEQGNDIFTAPGILRAFSPARVSRHFGFQGGPHSIDSACSSSTTAIQLACTGLINRDCDMALAGGAQIAGSPLEFSALGKSGFLAPSGGCKMFRADADGYCRGEAVGVLVLKRLEDALADNDRIEALITGWGRNYSADTTSMTHPHLESQEKLIRQVLRQANMKPDDIGYIELHGTGTTVGDLAEMTLINRLFGKHFKPQLPIHVGSVKANVGHSESASGVSSVIKAALILSKGIIPPQAMITPETQLHPGFANLDMSTICISSEPSLLRDRKKILVNSFDAAGGNTCLLIERAPEPVEIVYQADDILLEYGPRGWYSVAVSAQTSKSLQDNKKHLLEYLVKYPETELMNVAYSTTARRMHYAWRCEYTVESTDQLIKRLSDDISHPNQTVSSTTTKKPKIVFLFNGQGTSCLGIAEELYDTQPVFREYLNALNELCYHVYPEMHGHIVSLLLNEELSPNGAYAAEQHLTIVCFQLALAELWKSWGLEPDLVLGHSIGEYAALSVAGVLSVADVLWLVSRRAILFEETYSTGEYGMLYLSATEDVVRDLLHNLELEETCSIACFNSHTSHVIGGPQMDLQEIELFADSEGISTRFLAMRQAVHSKPMENIYEKIEEIAGKVIFHSPQIPVASTVTGEIVTQDGIFNAQYIARHACEPVLFSNALKSSEEFLVDNQASPLWVEIGSGSTYLNLLRQTLDVSPSQILPSMHGAGSNWKTLTNSLGKAYVAGVAVDWVEFHRHSLQPLKLLDLPTYAFDLKTFWRPYTKATASAVGINMSDGGRTEYRFVPTATIQKIQHQKVTSERFEVTFVSSLSDPRLRDAIKAHSIEGICVCPASVYIDMAFTAAAYVYKMVSQDKKSLGWLKNIELNTPFVLGKHSENQAIEIRVLAERHHDWKANISFHSQTSTGQVEDHGSCQVLCSDGIDTGPEWRDLVKEVRARIAMIMNMKSNPQARIDHVHRRMFYRLYNTAVKYDSRYQGITEGFIHDAGKDSKMHEAVAEVKFTATPDGEKGAFTLSPYHSDSLVHIGGFVLNIELSDDDEDILYFVSGIGSVTLLDELSEKNTYRSYFCTFPAPDGESVAHVYILNEDQVVGVVTGLKFRKIKREVLKAMLLEAQSKGTLPTTAQAREAVTQSHLGDSSVATNAVAPPQRGNMADAFISALIAETGISQDDIEDDTILSELGVDSLMWIAIVRKIKSDTNQTLPLSILSKLRTIRDVKERLGSLNNEASTECSPSLLTHATDLTIHYKSNAVLLHGPNPYSPSPPLFLIAGSSGSAAIFAHMPALASFRAVWVLESPFLHCPTALNPTHTPQALAPIYVAAMKAHQPTGPYFLGGYSAGAVHAYEVARLLLEAGDEVAHLVLIDMKAHCPGETWDAAPRMEDAEMLGAALAASGNSNSPTRMSWDAAAQKLANERLFASLRCMYAWKPVPMDPGRRPKNTVVIWARWGMGQSMLGREGGSGGRVNPMAAENRDYKAWFCGPRYSYGANGWDVLVGDVQAHVVYGDHWSMLQMPYIAEVSKLIDQAITTGLEN